MKSAGSFYTLLTVLAAVYLSIATFCPFSYLLASHLHYSKILLPSSSFPTLPFSDFAPSTFSSTLALLCFSTSLSFLSQFWTSQLLSLHISLFNSHYLNYLGFKWKTVLLLYACLPPNWENVQEFDF